MCLALSWMLSPLKHQFEGTGIAYFVLDPIQSKRSWLTRITPYVQTQPSPENLVCAVICSLGLISIIRLALRFLSLLASEPRLANTYTGVKRKALKTFPKVSYSTELKLPGLDSECVICLSDFTPSDRVRLLPKCNHGFHVGYIDKRLKSHSSCPKCRHRLIETCEKSLIGTGSTAGNHFELTDISS
ncbi:actin-7 [Hibiscus syriacus]|uniref:RING-type E3 ubiquitin transferase n=1 Tax=Hibiscus syriacus TaxID=106335 RepID=A0A6A3AQH9_HIBSY|nr:actin-7 [Hibiscus syriacus]